MTESVQNKLEWSSRFVFIMACVGGAVGLGNIWMFPYKAGTNGGGAFVLIYIAAVMLLALPVCIAELMIGRRGGGGPPNAIARVAIESGHTKHWRWMGVILAGVGAVFALSFYSVVGGWTVAFAAKTVTGQISGLEANQIINLFDELNGNPVELYTWFCVFIGMTVYISSRGLHKGLEQAVRLMMPALFVMLIMTVFYAAIIGDFAAALSFLFTPDFSKVDTQIVMTAFGQAFFSVSVGLTNLVAYGAYLKKEVNIPESATIICGADSLVAILAGLAVFPIIFANIREIRFSNFNNYKKLMPYGSGTFIGILLGAYIFHNTKSEIISIAIGFTIIGFAFVNFYGFKIKESLILNKISFSVCLDRMERRRVLITKIRPNVSIATSKKLLITVTVLILISESCSANNPSNPNGRRYFNQVISV